MMRRLSIIHVLILATKSLASTANGPSKPPFLSHVDSVQMNAALESAKERHDNAVKNALSDYDTDSVDPKVDSQVAEAKFKKYTISAPGALPDFGDELERAVYVTDPPLFSKEECDQVIRDAEEFNNDEWGMIPSGQYMISGMWIKDIPKVREWFCKVARQRLFPVLQRLYPDFVEDPGDLCIDSAYLFKYTAETGKRTDVHTDSGCLSFTIALNSNDEYGGGGTWFEGLDKEDGQIVEMNAGQVTLRPGGVRHAGCATESGARYIIGGFMLNRKRVEPVRILLGKVANLSEGAQKKLTEAAICLNPGCDIGYNCLANYYEESSGDVSKAEEVLTYGLKHAHPGSGELAYSLGSILLDRGDLEGALDLMKVCLEMDDCDIDALTTMGDIYHRLGDAEKERAAYLRIVEAPAAADKSVATAYCNLGVLCQGTDDEVLYYIKALEKCPQQFPPRYSLGSAYGSRGMWKEAVECFRAAATVAPSDEDRLHALKALYQAVRYLLQSENLTDREAMIARFQEVMGPENYQELASSR